jgi:hypothetical protein
MGIKKGKTKTEGKGGGVKKKPETGGGPCDE